MLGWHATAPMICLLRGRIPRRLREDSHAETLPAGLDADEWRGGYGICGWGRAGDRLLEGVDCGYESFRQHYICVESCRLGSHGPQGFGVLEAGCARTGSSRLPPFLLKKQTQQRSAVIVFRNPGP